MTWAFLQLWLRSWVVLAACPTRGSISLTCALLLAGMFPEGGPTHGWQHPWHDRHSLEPSQAQRPEPTLSPYIVSQSKSSMSSQPGPICHAKLHAGSTHRSSGTSGAIVNLSEHSGDARRVSKSTEMTVSLVVAKPPVHTSGTFARWSITS